MFRAPCRALPLALSLAACTALPPPRTPAPPPAPSPQWAGVYTGTCDLLVAAGEERQHCEPLLFVSLFPAQTRNFVVQTREGFVVGFRTRPTAVSAQHHEVAEVVVGEYPPLPALGHCDFVMTPDRKGSLFCECYAGGKPYRAHFRVSALKQASGRAPQ